MAKVTLSSSDNTVAAVIGPSNLGSSAVVATRGEVVNLGIWPGCSNPDLATFIPANSPDGVGCSDGGDVERGVLLSTFRSGQGASGSPVFRDNEVVGVVYAGAPEEDDLSLNIATDTFAGWLQDIVAGN